MEITNNRKMWFWATQCLSISRVFLMFLFIVLCPFPAMWHISAAIYLLAWGTDLVDGRLARSKKVVSLFGDAMDVFGDRYSTVVSCVYAGFRGVYLVPIAIILLRELFSVAVRMVRVDGRPAMAQNHAVGGVVHLVIAGATLALVVNPETSADFYFSIPFTAIAVFYLIYFPLTIHRSRLNLWKAISADLEES